MVSSVGTSSTAMTQLACLDSNSSTIRETAPRLSIQADDRVAKSDDERLFAREIFAAKNRIAQTSLHPLPGVEEIGPAVPRNAVRQEDRLVRFFRSSRIQLRIAVEMILDRTLGSAGNKEDLGKSVGDQFFRHVLHDRLASDGQHFFGLRLGRGKQTGSVTGDGYDSAANHFLRL